MSLHVQIKEQFDEIIKFSEKQFDELKKMRKFNEKEYEIDFEKIMNIENKELKKQTLLMALDYRKSDKENYEKFESFIMRELIRKEEIYDTLCSFFLLEFGIKAPLARKKKKRYFERYLKCIKTLEMNENIAKLYKNKKIQFYEIINNKQILKKRGK